MPDVICPHCGRSKAVTAETFASIAGKTIRCGCKAEFVVEEQDPLDFLDAPAAPVIPPTIAPTLTNNLREAIVERNVAEYRASQSQSVLFELAVGIGQVSVWILVAGLVIGASLYAGDTSGGGIGVLVFVASLIAILLYQVIDLLLRIVGLLEKD